MEWFLTVVVRKNERRQKEKTKTGTEGWGKEKVGGEKMSKNPLALRSVMLSNIRSIRPSPGNNFDELQVNVRFMTRV